MSAGADASPVHRYRARASWRGSTGVGYDAYDRTHEAACPPAAPALTVTADPAFRGVPGHLNPEQLLLLAATSCQLLSFLAVAARARIDVVAYADDAEALMPEGRPTRITTIVLRPRIDVRPGPTPDRVRRLVEVAHRECYIANSISSAIEIEPTIRFVDPA